MPAAACSGDDRVGHEPESDPERSASDVGQGSRDHVPHSFEFRPRGRMCPQSAGYETASKFRRKDFRHRLADQSLRVGKALGSNAATDD